MESKFIALYGRPNAGKFTAALAMAKDFSERGGLDVVVLLANDYEPKLSIAIPKSKLVSDKKSLGELIISPTLSETEVLQNLAPLPDSANKVYLLGYKNGDNPFTYTAPVLSQMKELFTILNHIADIVISVPMALFWMDRLSEFMLAESGLVYYLHELSPQSLSFYRSGKEAVAAQIKGERRDVLNKVEKEDAGLTRAYEEEIGEMERRFPRVEEIERNYKNGNLGAVLGTPDGKKYAAEIAKMCNGALGRERRQEKGGERHGMPDSEE
jgi:hypothetical protein